MARTDRSLRTAEVEADLDREEKLLNLLESRRGSLDGGTLSAIGESYQRVCQRYGYLATYYPQARTARRAQALVLRARRLIYGKRVKRIHDPLPYLGRLRRAFRSVAPYTALAIAIGVLSGLATSAVVSINPGVGWGFVNEDTRAALARGEIWTDQVRGIESIAAAGILTNNITVSFVAFAAGISAGVLTVLVLIMNGAHLGGIFTVLTHYDMADRLLDFIVAHGFLELSIIFVAAGTGLYIGDAVLRPGFLPRTVALRERARVAIDVVLFSALWLVVAGIVEGYISPHNIAFGVKLSLGLFLASVYWYCLARVDRHDRR